MKHYLEQDLFIDNKLSLLMILKEKIFKNILLDERFAIDNDFKKFHMCFFTLKDIEDISDKIFCVSLCHTIFNNDFFLSINNIYEINCIGEKRFYDKIKNTYEYFLNQKASYIPYVLNVFEFLLKKSINFKKDNFIFMGL